ncbi:protein TolR [Chiayiivirga flava]|uniref:Tol-Pal system protein TolR n=1 Tax=Chiayiivirga flava TaxID=659595 RepID=A0A7W8DB53_9GAMM|nr:protein TolR [Chiayiivirga flava]MBB5209478.1 biopolymer transport protein TolR [Chiayiivirga flava]
MATSRRRKRKLKAEINVVPYIDVMLVLLIIFMVTAPLLNLGVDIELPQANAAPVTQQKDPVIVEVRAQGQYMLKLQDEPPEEIDEQALQAKIAAFVRQNPDTPIFIAGDKRAEYGLIYRGMALLQSAGVKRISFMGEPLSPGEN